MHLSLLFSPDHQIWDATFRHILQDAVTLFVIVDPIALVPLFISLTRREDALQRQKIALRAVTIAAIVLISFIVLGQFLLNALGISLEAFEIAGGLVLMIIGLQMIFEQVTAEEAIDQENKVATIGSDIAVFPLAIPFIAGPGAILSVVLLTDNAKFSFSEQAITALVVLVVLACTYGILRGSEWIQRLLKDTGTNILTRIIGLLVVAIAIQTILTGITSFFKI